MKKVSLIVFVAVISFVFVLISNPQKAQAVAHTCTVSYSGSSTIQRTQTLDENWSWNFDPPFQSLNTVARFNITDPATSGQLAILQNPSSSNNLWKVKANSNASFGVHTLNVSVNITGDVDSGTYQCNSVQMRVGSTVTQNNVGGLSIDAISLASNLLSLSGTGSGGSTLPVSNATCSTNFRNPGEIETITSATELDLPTTWSIDSGVLTGNYTLTQTQSGNSVSSCTQTQLRSFLYSFNISNINVSSLSIGTHTIVISALDVATGATITTSAIFQIQGATLIPGIAVSPRTKTFLFSLIGNQINGNFQISNTGASGAPNIDYSPVTRYNPIYNGNPLDGPVAGGTIPPGGSVVASFSGTVNTSGLAQGETRTLGTITEICQNNPCSPSSDSVQIDFVYDPPPATATCPSTGNVVSLASSSINVGSTTTASAPAGFSSGSFSSTSPSIASVSGSTVTGQSQGSASISGSNWTYSNGATGCSLSGAAISVGTSGKTLTVNTQGSGTGNVSTSPPGFNDCSGICSAGYATGTLVTITANPTNGSLWGGWGGDCASFGTALQCNLTMNVDHINVTATFNLPPPACTASPNPVVANQQVTFTASGGNGFSYSWSAPGASPSSSTFNPFATSYFTSGTKTVTVTSALTTGNQSGTCTVEVTPVSPTADIKANGLDGPITISHNTSATISWGSTDATSCSVTKNGAFFASGTSGSQSSGNLTTNTTFALACSGPGGTANDSVTINVTTAAIPGIGFSKTSSFFSYPQTSISDSFLVSNIGEPGSRMSYSGSKSSVAALALNPLAGNAAFGSDVSTNSPLAASFTGSVNVSLLTPNPSPQYLGTITEACTNTNPSCTPSSAAIDIYYSYNPATPTPTPTPTSFPTPTPTPTPNSPPVTSSVSVTELNYCTSIGATIGGAYSDPDSDPMSAYQVQVDEAGNSFNLPVIDSGKVPASGASFQFAASSGLQFNVTYKARGRVWDSRDTPSSWTNQTICNGPGCIGGSQWKTPRHSYPQADFSWSPVSPQANQLTQFSDQSTCYNNSNNPIPCSSWSWNFGDSSSSTLRNPTHTFVSQGSYNVNLSASDNDNYTCSAPTKTLTVQSAVTIPTWKEVSPK